jgi:hypothetical protein
MPAIRPGPPGAGSLRCSPHDRSSLAPETLRCSGRWVAIELRSTEYVSSGEADRMVTAARSRDADSATRDTDRSHVAQVRSKASRCPRSCPMRATTIFHTQPLSDNQYPARHHGEPAPAARWLQIVIGIRRSQLPLEAPVWVAGRGLDGLETQTAVWIVSSVDHESHIIYYGLGFRVVSVTKR